MLTLKLLSEEEIQQILNGAYKVLSQVGVEVKNAEALEVYANLGCGVNGTRVTIPREVVEKSLQTVPQYIDIYDREGNLAMKLGGRNSYYGSGPTCPNFIDPDTGERRTATKQDAVATAVVSDALPNIDYVMALVMINDSPRGLADIHEVDAMVRNSTKPIATWAFNGHNTQTIIDMCAGVKGGLKELQEKPFVIVYAEPTTPLTHCKEALDKLMILAKNRIPVIYSPGMIMGGTAPVTMCGALSVGISESLSGIVLHQAVCPGAPIISSAAGTILDMKHMKTPYGTPESLLMYAASSEIYRYLGVPSFGLAGATEAKSLDAQAGYESALQIFMNEGSGANLIHDVGFTDYGLTGSCNQLIMCDEIIGHVQRLFRGIDIDDGRMGFETVAKVGPGGNFLGEEHTFEYFRSDIWNNDISDRGSYEEWVDNGGKSLDVVVAEKFQSILANHKPIPLGKEVIDRLDAIIEREEMLLK